MLETGKAIIANNFKVLIGNLNNNSLSNKFDQLRKIVRSGSCYYGDENRKYFHNISNFSNWILCLIDRNENGVIDRN